MTQQQGWDSHLGHLPPSTFQYLLEPSGAFLCHWLSCSQAAVRNDMIKKVYKQIRLSKLTLEGSRKAGFSSPGVGGRVGLKGQQMLP